MTQYEGDVLHFMRGIHQDSLPVVQQGHAVEVLACSLIFCRTYQAIIQLLISLTGF